MTDGSDRRAELLQADEAWEEELDLVFSTARGGVISPDLFTRWTEKLASEAGVRPLTPHPARHTWATPLARQGRSTPRSFSRGSVTPRYRSHLTANASSSRKWAGRRPRSWRR